METKDPRPMTTADLASRRPADERREQEERMGERQEAPRPMPAATAAAVEEEPHPFFPGDEGQGFRTAWREIQGSFVDDPRGSVRKADELVAKVVQRLAEVFAQERGGLESHWAQGGDPSTEDLRVALQRYRAFFDRLLSV